MKYLVRQFLAVEFEVYAETAEEAKQTALHPAYVVKTQWLYEDLDEEGPAIGAANIADEILPLEAP